MDGHIQKQLSQELCSLVEERSIKKKKVDECKTVKCGNRVTDNKIRKQANKYMAPTVCLSLP